MVVSDMLINSGTETRICTFEATSFGIGLAGPALAVTANVAEGEAVDIAASLIGGTTRWRTTSMATLGADALEFLVKEGRHRGHNTPAPTCMRCVAVAKREYELETTASPFLVVLVAGSHPGIVRSKIAANSADCPPPILISMGWVTSSRSTLQSRTAE